jgi:hypothetical protein
MNPTDPLNGTYGAKATAGEVKTWLRHYWESTFSPKMDTVPTPVCIWGTHGIGKTEIVTDLAREMGIAFAYLAPAQFEEMGDLLGMPYVTKEGQTSFAAPDWVPQEPGPGVLLIDDVNRADDRILRGIMQLLQRHELMSWELPEKWHIVMTANPEGGDYSVTPLDASFITRMHHVSLQWDLASWVRWAEGKSVDERAIQFVMMHPEVVDGRQTTPRTLASFFSQLQGLENWRAAQPLIRLLAEGALSKDAALAFLQYVRHEMGTLILPEAMATTDHVQQLGANVQALTAGPPRRIDLLSAYLQRLEQWVSEPDHVLSAQVSTNLKYWLTQTWIPEDLRFQLARQLSETNRKGIQSVLADPEVARLLLG